MSNTYNISQEQLNEILNAQQCKPMTCFIRLVAYKKRKILCKLSILQNLCNL